MGDVYGADWKLYNSNEQFVASHDAQSITHPSKDIVRLWTRFDYTEKGVLGWVKNLGKKYENLSYVKGLWEINCLEKMRRILSMTDYDNKGNVIHSTSSPDEWKFIIPETMGESLYNEVCK
jgi:hypothetical protein